MFTKNVFLPSYTIGEEAYREIANVCRKFGTKIVLIGGKRALSSAENKIRKSLEGEKFQILGSFWYGGEAAYENVEVLKAKKEILEADMIFAVGGGKAIDTCKVLSSYLNKELFTFPTIASTCASITSVCAMYDKNGAFKDLYWRAAPARHVFIDTDIIAQAPEKYLWAGIGDTLAKGYEPEFSARGKELDYQNSLGITLSKLCCAPLIKFGKKALESCREKRTSNELVEVISSIIVNTGLVSNCVANDYNSCVAHAICYGFSMLPSVEEKHLHGELVAYGVLVQLYLDNNIEELEKLMKFYDSIDLPTSYSRFSVSVEEIDNIVLKKASEVNDVKVTAFPVNYNSLRSALYGLENLEFGEKELKVV